MSWIRLHRKSVDSEVFQDPALWRLFTWCLMKANWETAMFLGQKIESGQFVTGRNTAADELNVSPSAWYRGIERLVELGCITTSANKRWTTITVCNWRTYQSGDQENRTSGDTSDATTGGHDQRIKEPKKKKKEEDVCSDTSEPAILIFPTIGKVETWNLTQSKIDEYASTYPGVNAMFECRKALQWTIDNKTRRKTVSGMLKFLNSWMSRAQNDSKGNPNVGNSNREQQSKFANNISAIDRFVARHGEGSRDGTSSPLRLEENGGVHGLAD